MILQAGPRPDPPLTELFGRELSLGAPLNGLVWLGSELWAACGDGHVRVLSPLVSVTRDILAHEGAILSLAADPAGHFLLTGGDDGRVVRTGAGDESERVHEAPGKWIDHVAAGRNGEIAWSEGRKAVVMTAGKRHVFEAPSSVGGLAFDEDAKRLAVAHYGGASVHAFEGGGPREKKFAWKGSHVGVAWSPNGRFLVTIMQENALHGWRLTDGGNMRMSGYPGRPKSLSWSANGLWLATSGAEGGVLWPFKGKDGPMGKSGELTGGRPSQVSAVAWHPKSEVLALGYADGGVFLTKRGDARLIVVRRPKAASIAALTWSRDGRYLAYGSGDGVCGSVDMAAAVR